MLAVLRALYKDQEPSASNLFECLCRKKREMIHLMYRLPLHVSFQIQLIAILDEKFLGDLMLYVMKCSIQHLCDEMLIYCCILGWAEMIMLFIWAL